MPRNRRDTPAVDRSHSFTATDLPQAHVVVLGATGGAGVTTLTRLIGPFAVDAGTTLTQPDGRPLVLVTRSTARGLHAATNLLGAAREAGHHSPILVIVGDGPWPAPPQARARRRMLDDRALTAAVIDVPYVIGWRDLDDPLTEATVPADIRRPIQQLNHISSLSSSQPTR